MTEGSDRPQYDRWLRNKEDAMTKWTPEPWTDKDAGGVLEIVSASEDSGTICYLSYNEKTDAHATRILSCVNALAGLNPEAVKGLVEAAKAALELSIWDSVCEGDPGYEEAIRFEAALDAVTRSGSKEEK